MDIREAFGSDGDDDVVLPEPTVEMRLSGDDSPFTPEQIRGIICNPIYAGIGPYPPLVNDGSWVRSAAKAINDDGKEQFLVNLLYLLRQSFQNAEIDFQ
jgi:hypothetical protein